jgi:hypothetical protein
MYLPMYNISSVLGTSPMLEKSRHKSVPTQEKRVAGIGMSEQKLATYLRVADISPTFPAKGTAKLRVGICDGVNLREAIA